MLEEIETHLEMWSPTLKALEKEGEEYFWIFLARPFILGLSVTE